MDEAIVKEPAFLRQDSNSDHVILAKKDYDLLWRLLHIGATTINGYLARWLALGVADELVMGIEHLVSEWRELSDRLASVLSTLETERKLLRKQ